MSQQQSYIGQVSGTIKRDSQAEELAHQTAQNITGPLTGKPVQQEAKPAPKGRKAASAFRTISEVAEILDVQQHVLRFWETKFSQIRPLKRGGGRRYYRPEDLELLKRIHHLLYTEGYTIKGVQKLLREKGKAQLLREKPGAAAPSAAKPPVQQPANATVTGSVTKANGLSAEQRNAMKSMVEDLKALREMIASE